ncbi:MAG: transcriptional repressor LexA [Pikeienuella sp.]
MLTRKQLDLLKFIHARVQRDGVSPSFDEMKEALDLRSKSGIHRLITALEERGFIRRLAHRARAIEILKLPEGIAAAQPTPKSATIIEHDFRSDPAPYEALKTIGAQEVPIVGRIAAGLPIEAIESGVDSVPAPASMLSSNAKHFALEVKGDSMIEAGIFEGDVVVVQSQPSANNGDIVVAIVGDHEATLKTFRRVGDVVELHAANPAFDTQRHHAENVQIRGRMVGLIRSYN